MVQSDVNHMKGTDVDSLPLKRANLRDQALAVIRQELVAGKIRAGEIYSASGMATRLGTSNGPVREAMLTLVNQGVMEVVPNRGFRVAPVTDHDLDEIYELRLMLEVPAVRKLATGSIGDAAEQVRDHARACTKAAENGDLIAFLEADRGFHLSMLALLGNRRLVQMVKLLRDQTRLYGLGQLAEEGRLVATSLEHFELLDAVVAGQPEEAARVMTAHLGHVRSDWSEPGARPATDASPDRTSTPSRRQ